MSAPFYTINHFFRLLLLKSKPQDLQYSIIAFACLLGALFLLIMININFLVTSVGTTAAATTAPERIHDLKTLFTAAIIIHESIFLAILHFTLKRASKTNRFIQVATNFIGIDLIEYLITMLLTQAAFGLLAICALKAWLLVIKFHITLHAFNVSRMRAAWIFLVISACSLLGASLLLVPYTRSVLG